MSYAIPKIARKWIGYREFGKIIDIWQENYSFDTDYSGMICQLFAEAVGLTEVDVIDWEQYELVHK